MLISFKRIDLRDHKRFSILFLFAAADIPGSEGNLDSGIEAVPTSAKHSTLVPMTGRNAAVALFGQ